MGCSQFLENLMAMDDATWKRHANLWGVARHFFALQHAASVRIQPSGSACDPARCAAPQRCPSGARTSTMSENGPKTYRIKCDKF